MTKEKQIKFEREEIAEIIAKNFRLNDEQYDASDFEWSAYQVQEAGYRKASDVIAEFKAIVKQDLIDKGLYLAITKNALDKAEKEILRGE